MCNWRKRCLKLYMASRKTISRKVVYCLALLLLLNSLMLTFGCRDKESYKREIKRKGITYSTDSFLNETVAGNQERIELFINAGMNVNSQDHDGYSAVMLASVNDNLDVVNLLIEKGADVNARDNRGYTALMFVSSQGNVSVAKVLIKKGAEVNVKNNEGETALMLASLNRNLEIMKLLMEKRADVNAKSDKGNTALKYAFPDMKIGDLLRKAGAKE